MSETINDGPNWYKVTDRYLDIKLGAEHTDAWLTDAHTNWWDAYSLDDCPTCDVCGEEFTESEYDERCWPHKLDCPDYELDDKPGGCGCMAEVHPRCCWECEEDES